MAVTYNIIPVTVTRHLFFLLKFNIANLDLIISISFLVQYFLKSNVYMRPSSITLASTSYRNKILFVVMYTLQLFNLFAFIFFTLHLITFLHGSTATLFFYFQDSIILLFISFASENICS